MQSAPGSLVRARDLAPWMMAVTGIITILQFFVMARGDEPLLVLGAFVLPTVGTTSLAWHLARRKWGGVLLTFFAVPLVHVLAASLFLALTDLRNSDGAVLTLVFDGVTAVLAFPALVAAAAFGPRVDHDAGDVLLGAGGLWFLAEQLLCMTVAEHEAQSWVFVVGAALGALAIAVAIARAAYRRAWLDRVRRGLVSGWRVNAMADPSPGLAPLFGGRRAWAVLERTEVQGTAYRSAVVGMPVALVPEPMRS